MEDITFVVSTTTGAIWSCDIDCDGFKLLADEGGFKVGSVCDSDTLSETLIRMEEGFDADFKSEKKLEAYKTK